MAAQEKSKVFRDSSMARLSSPEQLKEYIRVTGLNVWLTLAAVLVALAGLACWGFFGSITVSYDCVGAARGGVVTVYVADAESIEVGMEAEIAGATYAVEAVSYEPVARDALKEQYDAFTVYSLNPSEFTYPVTIAADVPDGVIVVKIVTDRAKPISYLFN